MANRYDRERYGRYYDEDDRYGRDYERSRSYADNDRDHYGREGTYRNRRRDERDFWDRASDEVSSWMGDEEAARRRRMDEREENRSDSYRRDYGNRDYLRQRRYDQPNYGSRYRTGEGTGEPGYGYPESESGYGEGYYGGYGREGHMFGTSGREYERSYRPDVLDTDYPLTYGHGYGGYNERRATGTSQNWTSRGRHTGRGPRGYKRSDERIVEDVNEQLMRHGDIDASDIEVNVNNGEVTLSGTVDHRWIKRVAEDVAEDVSGVTNVINLLKVDENFTQRWKEQETESDQTQNTEQTGRSKSASAKGR